MRDDERRARGGRPSWLVVLAVFGVLVGVLVAIAAGLSIKDRTTDRRDKDRWQELTRKRSAVENEIEIRRLELTQQNPKVESIAPEHREKFFANDPTYRELTDRLDKIETELATIRRAHPDWEWAR